MFPRSTWCSGRRGKQPCWFPPALPFPMIECLDSRCCLRQGRMTSPACRSPCVAQAFLCTSGTCPVPAGLSPGHADADPAPGLHQAGQRFPVFAVASALPKPCCCPVGTGAGCCFWSEPEGDVPTACTQVWLMMVELSTWLFLSLLPIPRGNRCFSSRGADDVVKMWFVFVLFCLFCFLI